MTVDLKAYGSTLHDILKTNFQKQYKAFDGIDLVEAGHYALSEQGKMLRGLMLLNACEAVGGNAEIAWQGAACIEYGHLASLIHDDIIDGDETRRSLRSVWDKYGINVALLTGDLFIFQAFKTLVSTQGTVPNDRVVWAVKALADASIDITLGQAVEAKVTSSVNVLLDDYLEVSRLKTGALFRCALEIGAILGGGSAGQIEALRSFGENLGVCFQMADDLLCYMSEDSRLKKPVTSDLKNKRKTLPVLYGLLMASGEELEVLRDAFDSTDSNGERDSADDYQTVRRLLHDCGAIDSAVELFDQYYSETTEYLKCLPENGGVKSLLQVSSLIRHSIHSEYSR